MTPMKVFAALTIFAKALAESGVAGRVEVTLLPDDWSRLEDRLMREFQDQGIELTAGQAEGLKVAGIHYVVRLDLS